MSVLELDRIDLRADAAARRFVKRETVSVEFAITSGVLMSRVGPNSFLPGDAVVTGADGDRWCVSRDRFDVGYAPLPGVAPGAPGRYQNRPRVILAKQMNEAFRCRRAAGGDWLAGRAGDWLLQYAPGDYGIAADARFRLVYRPVQAPASLA
jgi:hypothetical protein